MALDFSQDYLIWDTYEAGTLTSRDNAGNTDLSIARAHRNALTRREIEASQGAYRGDDIAFHLPTALLGSTTPKSGDYWTDADSVRYNVLIAIRSTHKATWRIICRNPIIAYGLRQRVNIYQATFAQDAGKARTPTFTLKYPAVAARIQPQDGSQEDTRGKRLDRRRYTIWVAEDLDVSADDQVRFDDAIYTINSWRGMETLDNLMALDCTRRD